MQTRLSLSPSATTITPVAAAAAAACIDVDNVRDGADMSGTTSGL